MSRIPARFSSRPPRAAAARSRRSARAPCRSRRGRRSESSAPGWRGARRMGEPALAVRILARPIVAAQQDGGRARQQGFERHAVALYRALPEARQRHPLRLEPGAADTCGRRRPAQIVSRATRGRLRISAVIRRISAVPTSAPPRARPPARHWRRRRPRLCAKGRSSVTMPSRAAMRERFAAAAAHGDDQIGPRRDHRDRLPSLRG